MRRVGDLMKDLGFRDDAREETARAFIENLVRAASGERWSSKEVTKPQAPAAPQQEVQLSFDFDSDEPEVSVKLTRKSS